MFKYNTTNFCGRPWFELVEQAEQLYVIMTEQVDVDVVGCTGCTNGYIYIITIFQ